MQNAKSKITKIFLISFFLLSFFSKNSLASTSRNLTIFAEQNMVMAMTKIARIYSQKSNVIVSVNFGSSSDLMNSIDSGEPADVFISAHLGWIETLRHKGLIDVYNVGYIARDELVLVANKSNPNLSEELKSSKSFENSLEILNRNGSTLVLDNEGNSSGKFSHDLIKKNLLPNLQLLHKSTEDKSPILNVVKSGKDQYALLLMSQVKNDFDLEILATKKDENIFYQALVIAGDNMEIAREFLKFLSSDAAKKILKESGFVVD